MKRARPAEPAAAAPAAAAATPAGAAPGPASSAARTGPASSAARTGPASSAAGGRLFIVATPIGNLGDVTFRAVEVLKAVPLVAAEDTRLSRRLFARYEITTHLVSYHAQSGPAREVELLDHLRSGRDLALVTDAGTPMVSDPGSQLAGAWAAEGGTVVPIPGASAVLAALVASGLAAPRWAFEGFLPRSGRERRDRLARIGADERACVVYEAPSRVPATLSDLAAACGGERSAAVCRELTKLHEEVVRGTLDDLADRAAAGQILLRGEFAIVVEGRSAGSSGTAAAPAAITPTMAEGRAEVARLIAAGSKRSDAVRQVAASSGLDRRELYRPA